MTGHDETSSSELDMTNTHRMHCCHEDVAKH